jgi:O-antigen ligase
LSEGHEAYLDLLVQIGCAGTLIVLYAVLAWPARRLLYGGDHPARTLAAAIIVFCIGHGFSESQVFDRDSLVQVLLMIAIALLWSVTAAPVKGGLAAVPRRPQPSQPRAPLRL